MTNDLRIELRFKNAILARALEEQFGDAARKAKVGPILPLIAVASEAIGVHRLQLSNLLNLNCNPRRCRKNQDELIPTIPAKKIADHLVLDFDELFPEALYRGTFKTARTAELQSVRLLGIGAAKRITAADVHSDLENADSAAKINEALITLTPKQQKIVEMRFGLNGHQEHTLRQIAEHFDNTPECIRQTESKCLRKLRHPSRSETLRKLLPPHYET